MSTSMLNLPSLSVMELACMLVEVDANGSPRPLFRSKKASRSDRRGVSESIDIFDDISMSFQLNAGMYSEVPIFLIVVS